MEWFCRYLQRELSLDEDDYEVIYYGLFTLVHQLISFGAVFGIGYELGLLKETLLLTMFYYPIRLIFEGYHAKTPIQCQIIFISSYSLCIFMIPYKIDILLGIILCLFYILLFIHDMSDKQMITLILYSLLLLTPLRHIEIIAMIYVLILYGIKEYA